jgi:hypothetical protein
VEKSLPGRLLLVAYALVFVVLGPVLPAQEIPRAVAPSDAYHASSKGIIIVEVAYGLDGKVQAARVVRSNAPFALESSVIDTIKKQWQVPLFAGSAMTFPIFFDSPPAATNAWNEDTPPPHYLLPAGDAGRTLKLKVSFGNDGWVANEHVIQSSGIELLDTNTEIWIKVHWHHAAFANQDKVVPIEFLPRGATSPSMAPSFAANATTASVTGAPSSSAKQKAGKKKHSALAEPIDTDAAQVQPAVPAAPAQPAVPAEAAQPAVRAQ